ncbi:nucleotidyltransferase family protein [Candidatus Uhrbacteria bacterium]|nr:nucleotidyltransferase family protein [Candidatus Uhrbacteria bacterium]
MQAVILAAGLGTRLRPLTETMPKPLIPVAGVPVLERVLDELPAAVTGIIIVVGHLREQIREQIGTIWNGRPVQYVPQEELLGTGHAVHCAREFITGKFLVLNGDDLYHRSDLEKLVLHDLGLLVCEVREPVESGAVLFDEQGHLVAIHETTTTTLVNTNSCVLDERFFTYELVPKAPGASELGLPQTIARMAQDHHVAVVRGDFWMPIGTHEELARAEAHFHSRDAVVS